MAGNKSIFRLELARTGKFGADGKEITREDLQDVVETFTPTPISIGHQMTRDGDYWPSFGSVETVHLEDKGEEVVLVGDVLIEDVLAEAIKNGFYPGWSVSIPPRGSDGKRYLHHLAFLGATPPAIRDLQILKISSEAPEEKSGESPREEGSDPYAPSVRAEFSFSDMGLNASELFKTEAEEDSEKSDFSDERVKKAEEIIAKSRKERIKATLSPLLPGGLESELDEFADTLIASYDFSDEEPRIISILEKLSAAIRKKMERPKTGRNSDFSDLGRKPDVAIDYQALAGKF